MIENEIEQLCERYRRLFTEIAAERDEWRRKAQEQSDEVQELWLSPCKAEELRQQLTDARRVARLWFRRAYEPMVEVEITGKEIVEALQNERQLRRKAERRAEENADYIQWLHRTLKGGGYILSTNEDGILAIATSPMQELKREKAEAEQRAERAGLLQQECDRWRGDWESITAELLDTRERLADAKQRAKHAETLAALVTPELTGLLERLSTSWIGKLDDKENARELAAKIREALDDSQA